MKNSTTKKKPKDLIKTDMPFEELMKKALNTPLPKEEKGKKEKKK